MRCRLAVLAALTLAPTSFALAQAPRPARTTPATPPAAATDTADENPIIARIDGQPLRLADVLGTAEEVLPPELRVMPGPALMQMLPPEVKRQLIERAITERVLADAARAIGLDKDPDTARRVRRAEEQELQQALLRREVAGRITDAAIRARYDRDNAGQQGEEEVHARHILVPTETEARQILAELQRGGDFAALARSKSQDPGARDGGDLGFFKKGDMVPEFANAAFALQPGQVSPAPVHTSFGWHIIKVEERRRATARPFDDVKQEVREALLQEEVTAAVQRIRGAARIERLDPSLTPPANSLLNQAAPPPPAQPTPTQPRRR
jgi:peptidyl-prolyl cis-trans isomerase C